jgi:hypothetical protein
VERIQTDEDSAAIQVAVLADWEAGNVHRDFYAKQVERNIADLEIERTLRSKSMWICRYSDFGQARLGFWHPQVRVVMVWRPAEAGFRSKMKSCFRRNNGDDYLEGQDDFEPVRWKR